VTTLEARAASSPDAATTLPVHTDWAAIEHALEDEIDLADALGALLAHDSAARSRALRDLQQAVHHQNTIYPATTPVALHIAALLPDPRTESVVGCERGEQPRQLRAALLDWLGEMAYDVGEESIAAGQRFGIGITPEQAELRAARPALLTATEPFINAADADVRHAAITTVLLLLDAPAERELHRAKYADLVDEVLATSSNPYHRARALDSLDAWGRDTTTLRRAEPTRVVDTANAWPQWNAEPPF
jgi:hypothetical protein